MTNSVLLVEDNPGDVRLIREAFRQANQALDVNVARDGEQAMAILRREGAHLQTARPDLILLDLNLPGLDGRQVLSEIKADEQLKTIPTVILTSSEAPEDIVTSYQLKANCYLQKPADAAELDGLVQSINDFWLVKARLPQRQRTE